MPKNKKKSYLVKPQGATVTAGKQNPKVERVAKAVGAVAAAAIPVGRVAKVASRAASAAAKAASKSKNTAKYATPSKVRIKGENYTVKKTKTGKTQITAPGGEKFTLKKGQSVQQVVSRYTNKVKEEAEIEKWSSGNLDYFTPPTFKSTLKEVSKKPRRR